MKKFLALLLISIFLIMGTGSAIEYYVIYNVPEAQYGSDGIYEDGYYTLLRYYNLSPTDALAVPKACSKLTAVQWNDTEMQTGGFAGALEFFQIDEVQNMGN